MAALRSGWSAFLLFGLGCLFGVGALAPAQADDWPQYRHDAHHSGASQDAINPPLTEVWEWKPALSDTGLLPARSVIWHHHAYFIGQEEGKRSLYCVDLRTGGLVWKQVLWGKNTRVSGIAISNMPGSYAWSEAACLVAEPGIVFVNDSEPQPHVLTDSFSSVDVRNGRSTSASIRASHTHSYVRAFRALDGAPMGMYPPLRAEQQVASQMVLTEPPLPRVDPQPGVPAGLYTWLGELTWTANSLVGLGSFGTMEGNSKYSSIPIPIPPGAGRRPATGRDLATREGGDELSSKDNNPALLFQWTPGMPASYEIFSHLHPYEPPNPLDPPRFEKLLVHFDGMPATEAGSGLLIGGGMRSLPTDWFSEQFLALLGRDPSQPVWHRHFIAPVSLPLTDGSQIFLRFPGTIFALNDSTGTTTWYADTSVKVADHRVIESPFGPAPFGPHDSVWHSESQMMVAGGSVFAVAPGLMALKEGDGKLLWYQDLRGTSTDWHAVASKKHVFVGCSRVERIKQRNVVHRYLLAINRESGKVEWAGEQPTLGEMSLSEGLMLVAGEGALRALAPAERTFRMAVDSPRKQDYAPHFRRNDTLTPSFDGLPPAPENPAALGVAAADSEMPDDPAPAGDEKQTAEPTALADASILRLQAKEPLLELIRKVRERRAMLGDLPLALSLDWMDATRTSSEGGPGSWTNKEVQGFADTCALLAAAGQPAFFDVAPEVNVYLARRPERVGTVRALLQAVKNAVHGTSPATQVLISYQVEMLTGGYGHGTTLPFGKVPAPHEKDRERILSLASEVDAVGLASEPATAFRNPADLPNGYLQPVRELFGKQPLVVTRLTAPLEADTQRAALKQALWTKRLIQSCYWLDARFVSYPDAYVEKQSDRAVDLALQIGETARPALAVWRDALFWKRVDHLSAAAAAAPQ